MFHEKPPSEIELDGGLVWKMNISVKTGSIESVFSFLF